MKLFGTDGIRGLFDSKEMNPELGFKFGAAMVVFCQKRNWPLKIMVGRDTRESGTILEEAVSSGIVSMGGQAILVGIIPTPSVSFLVKDQQAGSGIVISASHNSAEYNGLKPFKQDGTKLDDEEEMELESYIFGENILEIKGNSFASGKKAILKDAQERYCNFILKNLPVEFKKTNLKIVLDCANGSTFKVASDIFKKISNVAEVIHNNPDGKNINDDCGSQYTENLKKEVLLKGFDLGLAFDGDGDRMIAIDERGQELSGDQIIYVIAKFLKAKKILKNDLVVTTVMSNLGFVNSLKKIGIQHLATAVGDRAVFSEMRRVGAVLGGEESGHIIYSDYHPAGDGIVGSIMLIAAIEFFKKSLSKLVREVSMFPKTLVNIKVASKPEIETVPEIFSAIEKIKEKLGEKGRILVRYSGTENLCRVMIEGENKKDIITEAKKIAQIIREKLA